MQLEIPPSKNKEKKIDARTLVYKYLKLLELIPDKTQWHESVLKNNLPAYYRLLQLKSLCKVFEVGSVEYFLSGEFILERDGKQYHAIYSIMKSIEESVRRNTEYEKQGSENRVHVSRHITPKTKEQMQELVGAYKRHFRIAENTYIVQQLEKKLPKIENKEHADFMNFHFKMAVMNICQNVSPEGKTLYVREAIEQYGCPDVDVYALDEIYKNIA